MTSNLFQVLYFRLQCLNLTERVKTVKVADEPDRWRDGWMCYLVVNVQLVVLPGLQRLIQSCVTLHRRIGQNGTSAVKTQQSYLASFNQFTFTI